MAKILLINASPETKGHTARMAAEMIGAHEYQTLRLADYRINSYGSELPGDQLPEIIEQMKQADVVVIGTPVYWHNLAGVLRVLMDRFYGWIEEDAFEGTPMFAIYQGAAPTEWMLKDGEYTLERFAQMYGFSWQGMATSEREARELNRKFESVLAAL